MREKKSKSTKETAPGTLFMLHTDGWSYLLFVEPFQVSQGAEGFTNSVLHGEGGTQLWGSTGSGGKGGGAARSGPRAWIWTQSGAHPLKEPFHYASTQSPFSRTSWLTGLFRNGGPFVCMSLCLNLLSLFSSWFITAFPFNTTSFFYIEWE